MAARTRKRDSESTGEAAPQLLEFLVCPLTHTTLEYDRKRRELISHAARLAFPIRDGVPVMLVSEARKLQK